MTIKEFLKPDTGYDYLQVAMAKSLLHNREYEFNPWSRVRALIPELEGLTNDEIVVKIVDTYNDNPDAGLSISSMLNKSAYEQAKANLDGIANPVLSVQQIAHLPNASKYEICTVDNMEKLSELFSTKLYLSMNKLDFLQMVAQNNRENLDYKYGALCVSHEYADAGEVMLDVFKDLTGVDFNSENKEHEQLTQAAWLLAKRSDFYEPIIIKMVDQYHADPSAEEEIWQIVKDGKYMSRSMAKGNAPVFLPSEQMGYLYKKKAAQTIADTIKGAKVVRSPLFPEIKAQTDILAVHDADKVHADQLSEERNEVYGFMETLPENVLDEWYQSIVGYSILEESGSKADSTDIVRIMREYDYESGTYKFAQLGKKLMNDTVDPPLSPKKKRKN